MNTQLVSYFMSKPANFEKIKFEKIKEVSEKNIISILDNHFKGQWAWEITNEILIMDNSVVSTTVAVYIPGKILTGRALSKIKDYGENHLKALYDACAIIAEQYNTATVKIDGNPNANINTMSSDQIMEMINMQSQANTQPSEVPFELGEEFIPTSMNVPQNQSQMPPQPSNNIQNNNQPNDNYNQPNPSLGGFSQYQVDRMNKIKQDLDIISDDMLNNWINTWNNNLFTKKDLTPSNINGFLDWAEDFAKNM